MTRVTANDGYINISGHAGYANKGQDIVCAGLSALVFTAQASLEELTEDKIDFIFLDDEIIIEYSNISEKAKTIIDTLLIGVNLLADEYPYNIEVQA